MGMVVPKYPRGRMPVKTALEQIATQMEGEGQEAHVRPHAETTTNPIGVEHEQYVEVKWIGEPSYLQDPRVYVRLALMGKPGGFTERQARVIRAASRIRMGTFAGHTREMTRKHGFSRDYAWGARHKTYVQRMTLADANKLRSSVDGHEFVILGFEPEASPIILPPNYIKIISDREFKEITGYIDDSRPKEVPTRG